MLKQLMVVALVLFFAFSILFVSVFRTASLKYDFSEYGESQQMVSGEEVVDYYLPYMGRVLPDSPFWTLKALRDRLWLLVNTSPTKEAEIKLLFADKRLGASMAMFEAGNNEQGYSTLTKSEKYLEEAFEQNETNKRNGIKDAEFTFTLAKAALKHFDVIQNIKLITPDEVDASVVVLEVYPKRVYEGARNSLLDLGMDPPINPFEWE